MDACLDARELKEACCAAGVIVCTESDKAGPEMYHDGPSFAVQVAYINAN